MAGRLEGPCGLPQCCVRSWRLNPAVVLLIRAFVACSRVHMWCRTEQVSPQRSCGRDLSFRAPVQVTEETNKDINA